MQTVVEVRNVGKRYGIEGRKRDGSVTQALDHRELRGGGRRVHRHHGAERVGQVHAAQLPGHHRCAHKRQHPYRRARRGVARRQGAGAVQARELGFIFQDSNLLDTLTAYENIALALTIRKTPAREIDARVQEAASTLGISDVLQKHPYQMSGGQKQRVAAARATVGRPRLVLADEPTGALDSKSAKQLLESLAYLNSRGSTILMVTHDSFSAATATASSSSRTAACTASCADRAPTAGRSTARSWEMVSHMGGAGEDAPAEGEWRAMLARLALGNVRKSLADFGVYFLTVMLGVAVFYAFNSMTAQQGVLAFSETQDKMFELLGMVIGGVSVFIAFVLVFLWCTRTASSSSGASASSGCT